MTSPSRTRYFSVVLMALFVLPMLGCSDQTPQMVPRSAKFDHAHGKDVSDLEKHKFEHDFAEQCVAREIRTSINKNIDKKRFEKPCMCIARYIMKDLTADEARKFLVEHKNTQSLVIRFDNAAFHCLQQQAQPKSPTIFGKR